MRKFWKSIRTAMAWEVDVWNSSDAVLTMHNPVTGKWRHRKTMASSGSLWISPWVEGKPPQPARPEPPKGGSGVKPPPNPVINGLDLAAEGSGRIGIHIAGRKNPKEAAALRDDSFERLRDMAPGGLMLEEGLKVEPQPRRLQLTAAPKGGYIVGEPRIGDPFFKTVFAGNLSDCLNFMVREMEVGSC